MFYLASACTPCFFCLFSHTTRVRLAADGPGIEPPRNAASCSLVLADPSPKQDYFERSIRRQMLTF